MRVRSAVPIGVGLGSSAALSVALVRALVAATGRTLTADEELAHARRLEAIFHGHPSGVDPAAAALPAGACMRFVRGEPPTVALARRSLRRWSSAWPAGRARPAPRCAGSARAGKRIGRVTSVYSMPSAAWSTAASRRSCLAALVANFAAFVAATMIKTHPGTLPSH